MMTINTSIIKCDRLLLSVHCLHNTHLPSLSLSYCIACGSSEHGKQSIKHLQIKLLLSKDRKMKGAVMIAFIVHLQQTKSIDKEKCHGGLFINYKKYDMHTISAQLVLTMKLDVLFIK